jgi:hypothetical protein
MFHLPNCVYYSTLKELTRDQVLETIGKVIEYAALEMFSFVVLVVVLDRLVGYSTLRQLAFTLRKHALLAQSMLVLWVFFPTQLTLEHLGTNSKRRDPDSFFGGCSDALLSFASRERLHVSF